MKVILLTDVKKQGKKDDVINVSDGYATNFLINKGLAVPYNDENRKKLERDLKNRALEEEAFIKECEELKKKLEKISVKFKVKTSNDGRMFGTISSKQIAEELKRQGYDVDKKKIASGHTIDSLGTHIVKVNLHKKVIVDLKVVTE